MLRKILWRNKPSNKNGKCYVILFLVLLVGFEKPINCLTALNGLPANNFVAKCEQRCKDQVGSSRVSLDRLKVQTNQKVN